MLVCLPCPALFEDSSVTRLCQAMALSMDQVGPRIPLNSKNLPNKVLLLSLSTVDTASQTQAGHVMHDTKAV